MRVCVCARVCMCVFVCVSEWERENTILDYPPLSISAHPLSLSQFLSLTSPLSIYLSICLSVYLSRQ